MHACVLYRGIKTLSTRTWLGPQRERVPGQAATQQLAATLSERLAAGHARPLAHARDAVPAAVGEEAWPWANRTETYPGMVFFDSVYFDDFEAFLTENDHFVFF